MNDRARKTLRALRIAWTAFFAVLTVLLCVLWVRSYWWVDGLVIQTSRALVSAHGRIETAVVNTVPPTTLYFSGPHSIHFRPPKYKFLGFGLEQMPVVPRIRIPYWFAVIVAVALANASRVQCPTRFSLRTLLLATTLIAVGMGFVVWAVRS